MIDRTRSAPPWVAERKRLWSLWDMIYNFKAGVLTSAIANLDGEISMMVLRRAFTDYDFERHRDEILRQVKAIRAGLKEAPISPFLEGIWDRCEQRLGNMKADEASVGAELLVQLKQGLLTYLKQLTFLMVDNPNAMLFDEVAPFGDVVAVEFPLASSDVVEAARCLALERYTASVFHLMRVLEHGLRWAAKDLGRTMSPELDEQWKTLIDWMLSEIGKMEGLPNSTPNKQERLGFYSGVALDLRNFKNAWRNDVSHSRVTYDETEALRVWQHVKSFMQALAARIES